ncbi:NUDIX hydrolase [Pseudalkalibacillus caeni]|uniref:NUDIX hydrolase n=2 Tax=Exobacillus caeni TaxID=2574798 RepID=A0A5R9F3H6_9BACL|nr:NUDIX hydrolase [Pseudalkalibacillus caeni]
MYLYGPLAGSFTVMEKESKFLLCYNTYRKQWELPAGKREENETPRECAVRELYEETGQRPAELDFLGLMKLEKSDGEIKYNPVYYGQLAKLLPFSENEETDQIMLWDLSADIGTMDKIDRKLLQVVAGNL